MALTIEQLALIGKYLNIYLGSTMFIAGLFGSMMNIWLFTSHCFQKSPCSRLILASSIFDFIHLIVALLFRILADGFRIDPASSTVIACRIRYYLVTFSAYASVGCRCLAAFDRYVSTSRSHTLRRLNSLENVYRFLVINILFWACFALPNLFFFNLIRIDSTRVICHISKRIYSDYFAYFVNPVLYFALPLILLISLTVQTHRNLKLMNRTQRLKKLERQLTSMIVLQATANCVSSIPYGVQFFYAVVTRNGSKDQYRQAQEHLFLQITRLSYYINFISAFYIYCIASEQIRLLIRCRWRNPKKTSVNQGQVNEIRQSKDVLEREIFFDL